MLDHPNLVVPTHYGVSEVQFVEIESLLYANLFHGIVHGI